MQNTTMTQICMVHLIFQQNVLCHWDMAFFHDGSSALNVKVEAKIEYESV